MPGPGAPSTVEPAPPQAARRPPGPGGPSYDPAAPAPLGVERAPTGHAGVDARLGRLADADHLAADGHVEVYEDVHRGLRDALTALDARPGRRRPPGRPHRRTTTGAEPNVAGVARRRLDAELVRRKLARSREHASQLIAAGRVTVGGNTATKPATQVETSAAVVVVDRTTSDPDYVSRGGHKLAGALAAFVPLGLAVEGRRALDAGASTGGFTDVLLRAGAAARRRRRRRLRPARLVAAERRPRHRQGPYERTGVDARSTSTGSPSTWSSATSPSSRSAWCCPPSCAARRPTPTWC